MEVTVKETTYLVRGRKGHEDTNLDDDVRNWWTTTIQHSIAYCELQICIIFFFALSFILSSSTSSCFIWEDIGKYLLI
jgi:hypothetical protein